MHTRNVTRFIYNLILGNVLRHGAPVKGAQIGIPETREQYVG